MITLEHTQPKTSFSSSYPALFVVVMSEAQGARTDEEQGGVGREEDLEAVAPDVVEPVLHSTQVPPHPSYPSMLKTFPQYM